MFYSGEVAKESLGCRSEDKNCQQLCLLRQAARSGFDTKFNIVIFQANSDFAAVGQFAK